MVVEVQDIMLDVDEMLDVLLVAVVIVWYEAVVL